MNIAKVSKIKHPINILYISSSSSIGGGEVYLLSVMRHLDRNLYNPIVLLPDDGDFRLALDKINVVSVVVKLKYGWLMPSKSWHVFLSETATRINAIKDIIDKYNISLVHTNSNIFFDGALAALEKGIHHILVVHIPFSDAQPLFQRLNLSANNFACLINDISDHVIAVSEATANTLTPCIPDSNLSVINVGLELDIYEKSSSIKSDIRKELGLPEDCSIVVSIGRIDPDKGFDILLEAAYIVLQARQNTHFIIVGSIDEPHYYQRLISRMDQLKIENNLHFLGFRSDIPEILRQSNVFALTSFSEGGPYVLLEAMACRCAAVATKCGGIVENVIKDHVSGLLIEVGDFEALARNILVLLSDSSLAQNICENAYKIVDGNYEAKQSIDKLMDVYDKVLSRPAKSRPNYLIVLLRNAIEEHAYLGLRLEELYDRFNRVENLANKILNSLAYRILRKLAHKIGHLLSQNRQ